MGKGRRVPTGLGRNPGRPLIPMHVVAGPIALDQEFEDTFSPGYDDMGRLSSADL
jgi:hypothetical protein